MRRWDITELVQTSPNTFKHFHLPSPCSSLCASPYPSSSLPLSPFTSLLRLTTLPLPLPLRLALSLSPSPSHPLPLALSHFPFPSPTSPPCLFTSGSPSRSVCCHEPPPFLYLRLCSSIWSSQQHDLLPSPLSSSILAMLSPPPSPFDNQ